MGSIEFNVNFRFQTSIPATTFFGKVIYPYGHVSIIDEAFQGIDFYTVKLVNGTNEDLDP